MKEKYELDIITSLIFVALFIAMILSYLESNVEFLVGSITITLLLSASFYYRKKIHLTLGLLLGLCALILLHLFGGIIYIQGVRLYDSIFILKYDMWVHLFGTIVFSFVSYNLLKSYLDREIVHRPLDLALVLILMTIGFGALLEIFEGFIVISGFETGVGDYINNATDLLFDSIGAIIGALILVYYHGVYIFEKKS